MSRFIFVCTLFFSFQALSQPSGLQPVNGTRLFVRELGKGELVIVVHGGPGMNHTYFLPHLESLGRRARLILYDQRACGKSAMPASDSLRLSFHIDDIEALRKKYGAEKVHILGHSWGAFLAVGYGVQYPGNIKSMILVNPVPLSTEYREEMMAEQKRRLTREDSVESVSILSSADLKNGNSAAYERLLRLTFRHSFYDSNQIERLFIQLPANYREASQALFRGLSKDLNTYDYYGAINAFQFPTLVIHGRYDATPLTSVERIRSSGRLVTLSIYERTGHFAFIEEPERFNKEVSEWIRAKAFRRSPFPKETTGGRRR